MMLNKLLRRTILLAVFSIVPLCWVVVAASAKDAAVKFAFEKPVPLAFAALDKGFVSDAKKVAIANGATISMRQAYATLSFDITGGNEAYAKKLLGYFENYLKGKFGNESGTFTLIVRAKSKNGKLDIKQPILSFQWERKGILFFDKVVKEIVSTHLSGWIVDGVRLNHDLNTLELSLESYFKKSVSLDFSVFQSLGKLVNASQLSSVIPLSAPTLAIIDSVGGIFKLFFDKESEMSKSEVRDIKFISEDDTAVIQDYQFAFTFTKPDTTVLIKVPVNVRSTVSKSHFVRAFDGEKFDQSKLSSTDIETQTVTVGDVNVGLLEALSQSAADGDKPLKPFLASLTAAGAKPYKEADVNDQCGRFYGSLKRYFSDADARALLWSFVIRFGHNFEKNECLKGNRREELAAVGLKAD